MADDFGTGVRLYLSGSVDVIEMVMRQNDMGQVDIIVANHRQNLVVVKSRVDQQPFMADRVGEQIRIVFHFSDADLCKNHLACPQKCFFNANINLSAAAQETSMNLITHALIGWCAGLHSCRPRAEVVAVAAASVIPDIDAFGALIDLARGGEAEWFTAYHHKFGHCLPFCLLLVVLAWLWRKNARLCLWIAGIFHLHLLCDLIGARGPDGYQWPVYYLFPFSDRGLTWAYQWEINAWPNILLTVLLILSFLWQTASYGYSPLSLLSKSADRSFVETLQKRFGMTSPPGTEHV